MMSMEEGGRLFPTDSKFPCACVAGMGNTFVTIEGKVEGVYILM